MLISLPHPQTLEMFCPFLTDGSANEDAKPSSNKKTNWPEQEQFSAEPCNQIVWAWIEGGLSRSGSSLRSTNRPICWNHGAFTDLAETRAEPSFLKVHRADIFNISVFIGILSVIVHCAVPVESRSLAILRGSSGEGSSPKKYGVADARVALTDVQITIESPGKPTAPSDPVLRRAAAYSLRGNCLDGTWSS